jgi:glutaredoxin
MAKEFLKQKNVKFEDINIEENPEKAKEMVKLSGQTAVPVIDVDGKIIVGFDKERLKKNLRLK